MAPPAPAPAPTQPLANINDLSREQQSAVMGVLQLTREQVEGLPETQRVQVVKLVRSSASCYHGGCLFDFGYGAERVD